MKSMENKKEKESFVNDMNFDIDKNSEFFIEKEVAEKSKRFPYGPNAFSNSLLNVIKGFGKKYGFVNVDIIKNWNEIAGDDFSELLIPLKISFPFGQRSNGTLYVRVKKMSVLAIAQYQFPTIIDRINTYFGYPAVKQIRVRP